MRRVSVPHLETILNVCHGCDLLVMIILALCKIVLAFLGSSSSALGLQSLGLSGQAPSSSSLDAGTLSDTTASGNTTITVVACN